MRRGIWLASLLALCAAVPAYAQSDSARIAALEARVQILDSIVNTKGFLSPRWSCAETESRRPTTYFPSGEYDLYYRNRQFGCAFDPVAVKADSAMARVRELSVQTAAVSAKLDEHLAGAQSGGTVGMTYEAGTLYVPERIVIGNCKVPSRHMLQICGLNDAEIRFVTNLSGTNPQSAGLSHEAVFGAQGDGGTRWEFNWVCHTNDPPVTRDNGSCWIEPSKPRQILGFDSQGTLSFSNDVYPVIDNSQLWTYKIDRDNRWAGFSLMKAGYVHSLWTSTITNSFDKRYTVPQEQQ